MAARVDSVAELICRQGNWDVSNLRLQKILYMVQLNYMGSSQDRLVDANFEAWDYGPVEPGLYRRVRMFGSGPIENIFYSARTFTADDPRRTLIEMVCTALLPLSAGQLVDITHWSKGAWAKNYVPGARGIVIPDADIAEEFNARTAAAHVKDYA